MKIAIRSPALSCTILLVLDGLVFGMVNPRTAPGVLLGAGFLLLVATSYCLLRGLLAVPGLYGMPIHHKQRLLRTLTVLSGSLLALQSIGQLSPRDVVVLSLVTVLFYVYVSYAKAV